MYHPSASTSTASPPSVSASTSTSTLSPSRRRRLPASDRTSEFHALLSHNRSSYPPSSSSSSSSSPLTPARAGLPPSVVRAQRQWLSQAYTIRRHIVSLLAFLYSIRRQYLALSNSHRFTSASQPHANHPHDDPDSAGSGPFAQWQQFRGPLTERQRDEIDFQVKVVVKRCLDSIKELEMAEQARKKTAPTSPTAFSPLHTLLSLSTPRDSASSILASSMVSSHRASVVHYLSTLLSKASSLQSDMQELRLRAQREKSRSLANSRSHLDGVDPLLGATASSSLSSHTASSAVGKGPAVVLGSVGGSYNPALEAEADLVGRDITTQLSAAQIQALEFESSHLVKALESDLAAIQKAESRLYEISDLQTQVAQQLEQQKDITDTLLDDAIGVATEVGRGNEELKKARERSREADKMLSAFLVGSGLTLLFLHWMD
ncbi:hypothetical protein ACQY0O_004184 [Thecaphora frezii]